jgi:hypothetical protein
MRCFVSGATVVLLLLLAGCGGSDRVAIEAAKKAAEEQAAKEKADHEQAQREKEKLAVENRMREELSKDFEQVLGDWDHESGMGPNGQPMAFMRLEIRPNSVARILIVAGSVEASNECPIRLTGDGKQRFITALDSSAQLKLTPLAYRLDGDKLVLSGSASDIVLKDIDLSGEWRRTDWTKRTEAEIADVLKKLDGHPGYDETNPSKPIVKVAFNFQAPVHDAHLRVFAGLKNLQELDLSTASSISDAGLKHLAGLKQLKQLNLSSLSVSNEAVQELRKELPNCTIVR